MYINILETGKHTENYLKEICQNIYRVGPSVSFSLLPFCEPELFLINIYYCEHWNAFKTNIFQKKVQKLNLSIWLLIKINSQIRTQT